MQAGGGTVLGPVYHPVRVPSGSHVAGDGLGDELSREGGRMERAPFARKESAAGGGRPPSPDADRPAGLPSGEGRAGRGTAGRDALGKTLSGEGASDEEGSCEEASAGGAGSSSQPGLSDEGRAGGGTAGKALSGAGAAGKDLTGKEVSGDRVAGEGRTGGRTADQGAAREGLTGEGSAGHELPGPAREGRAVRRVRTSRRPRETGRRIRAAALRLFARHGYAAVSMRRIAREVGVQVGALYAHVPDKQGLLFELMRDHLEEVLAAWEATPKGDGPLERLEAFTRFHIDFHLARPEAVFIAYMELRNLTPENFAAIEKLRRRYEDALQAILAEGVQAGLFDVPDLKLATLAIIAMLTGVNTWYREGGRLPRSRIGDIYWDMVRKAVARGDGPPAPSALRGYRG